MINAFEFIRTYWNLLTSYLNPVPVAGSALLWMLVAGVSMLLLLILLRKKVLVKRAHMALRILSIAYFVLLPVAAGYFGFKWGFLRGLRNELREHAVVQLKPLDEEFRKTLAVFIAPLGRAGNMSLSEALSVSTNLVWDAYRADLHKRADAGGFSGTVSSLLLRFSNSGFVERAVKSKLSDLIASAIGDEGTAEAILSAKIFTLLGEGLFTKIIVFEINAIFKGLLRGVVQLFGLILLLPLTEISIAHYLLRRRKRAEAATVPAPAV